MKHLKKLTMTLALLLTAVTGAWAQTAFGVKEITADMLPASWSTDESAVTADDLAQFGFMEVTKAEAQAWTGAPQEGTVRLIYTLCESVNWVNGQGGYGSTYDSRKGFYSCLDGQRIFITTEITEWSLTPDDNKFVDCAFAAGADYLVSEDSHFRVLHDTPFPQLNLVTLDEFLATRLIQEQ